MADLLKNNKKGLSDVVTTVLIILFGIVAVAIIGGIVLSQVRGTGSKVSAQSACQDVSVEPVLCTYSISTAPAPVFSTAYVIYKRTGAGASVNIVNLSLILEKADGTTSPTVLFSNQIPGAGGYGGESKSRTIDFTATNPPKKFKTAVTIRGSDGKDIQCDTAPITITCADVSSRGSSGAVTIPANPVPGTVLTVTNPGSGYVKGSIYKFISGANSVYILVNDVSFSGGLEDNGVVVVAVTGTPCSAAACVGVGL